MEVFLFFLIALIVIILYAADRNQKSKIEKKITDAVGICSWNFPPSVDFNEIVKSRAALENYDDIKFFRDDRSRFEIVSNIVRERAALSRRIQDFLKNNNFKKNVYYKYGEKKLIALNNHLNGYVIKVDYITSAGNNLAWKTITISEGRLNWIKSRPNLYMSKTEYNQMTKKLLDNKKKSYYDRVNNIIDLANIKRDELVIKNKTQKLDRLIAVLFEKTVNSIQKVKSIDSEEWTMLDNYIARIENDVMSIIRENEMLLEYYSSEDFKQIKNTCDKLMQSQREFNEYIDQKAKSISQLFGRRITRNETNNDDVFNYIRPYKKSITPFTVTVSAQVFGSAENNPMEYIIKYFYPDRSQYEKQIDNLRILIEELETLKEAKVIIENYKKEYAEYIEGVPSFVLELDEDGFYSRLGFATIDESVLEIEYRFEYTSDGGKAGRSFGVSMTEEMIAELINQLENKLTMVSQIREQRALMTQKLREYIKKRDNYTCCICGNSVEKEPNLLLEIDHIIPISKGGLTEESNLQTLCWKCNRAKSDKLQYQYN